MKGSQMYFGGLPTGPDIKKLETAFPDMLSLRGTNISHESIEAVLGIRRDSARYKTVCAVWRRKVSRDSGIEIRGDLPEIVGVGLRVLSDSEQLHFGGDLRGRAAKRIRRSHIVIGGTDDAKLTPEEKRIKDHGILAARHIHAAMMESRKFLPSMPEPEETPKRPVKA